MVTDMGKSSTLFLYNKLRKELEPLYEQEANSIAILLIEDLTGFNPTEILIDKQIHDSDKIEAVLEEYLLQLKQEVPVQYVIGKAHFFGHQFSSDLD